MDRKRRSLQQEKENGKRGERKEKSVRSPEAQKPSGAIAR
jgi:hypothetical protein